MSDEISDSTGTFADLVAAGTATPGGGSVAAYSGVLASSLGRMMCNLTLGKARYAEVEPRVNEIKDELERLGARLRQLIAEDAASFEAVLGAYRRPKETDEQKADRKKQIDIATRGAVDVPFETARSALEVLKLLAELAKIGNPNALPDVTVGSRLAETAVKGAYYNIGINLKTLADRTAAQTIERRTTELIVETEGLAAEIEAIMLKQMESDP
jgi:formiminotetrahydrofolate cyclodeaminase